ncbi:spermidine resistance protein [Tulasnella sp. 417]|nr:spermidine resistance protein [Tulasnella sp. 417]
MTQAEVISDVPQEDAAALNVSPFEGPEKLLEVWFAPSAEDVAADDDELDEKIGVKRSGLRRVKREVWEEMLDIVKCKARLWNAHLKWCMFSRGFSYSESSLFVSPHKLILKTCGTTLNLLGLPKILSIAAAPPPLLTSVHRLWYSRKSFMFPERQQGPHREWTEEVSFLDKLFGPGHERGHRGIGAAYTVGSVNRDHWLCYVTAPPDEDDLLSPVEPVKDELAALSAPPLPQDFTLEILMSRLSAPGRRPFFFPDSPPPAAGSDAPASPHHIRGQALSKEVGITDLFPESQTTLDAFAFEPCGYSANGLVRHDQGEGYYTIHVTPEEGWSYASFECNIPLLTRSSSAVPSASSDKMPDLETLIQRVVNIFQPGHLTLTLFVSSNADDSPIETAQRTFFKALSAKALGFNYKRVDKINYEFGGYDLAFASFERRAGWEYQEHQPDWKVVVEPTLNS